MLIYDSRQHPHGFERDVLLPCLDQRQVLLRQTSSLGKLGLLEPTPEPSGSQIFPKDNLELVRDPVALGYWQERLAGTVLQPGGPLLWLLR